MDRPIYSVRQALESDIPSICSINAHYVLNTVLTFRYVPATHEQVLVDFKSVEKEGLPYIVATEDVSNTVTGYCYATRFRPPKLGYRPTVELSIFCSPQHVSRGVGSLLLGELLRMFRDSDAKSGESELSDVRNIMACMSVDEEGPDGGQALKRFYERFGFEEVGRLRGVGFKFDRWYVYETVSTACQLEGALKFASGLIQFTCNFPCDSAWLRKHRGSRASCCGSWDCAAEAVGVCSPITGQDSVGTATSRRGRYSMRSSTMICLGVSQHKHA